MQDLDTDKFILSKVVRRKPFILGKDPALTRREVVQMADGSVYMVAHRRAEYWDYGRPVPMVVASVFRGTSGFAGAVAFILKMEGNRVTQELPEVNA